MRAPPARRRTTSIGGSYARPSTSPTVPTRASVRRSSSSTLRPPADATRDRRHPASTPRPDRRALLEERARALDEVLTRHHRSPVPQVVEVDVVRVAPQAVEQLPLEQRD